MKTSWLEKLSGSWKTRPSQDSSQADNRQSETIKEALEMLKEVEVYNTLRRAAIELPSVQTPSQIKKFYEPVMDMEGVEIAGKTQLTEKQISFDLPDFQLKKGNWSRNW